MSVKESNTPELTNNFTIEQSMCTANHKYRQLIQTCSDTNILSMNK
jgi:hypothetical protein